MKISIILPVYNEVNTLETLLERVYQQPIPGHTKELVIVESNSKDGSREVVQQFAARHAQTLEPEIKVVLQDSPRGKGFAVRAGLKKVSGDIILIQDGDLEYDVRDYPALIAPIADGRTRFVLGSRHLATGQWKIRKFDEDPFRSTLLNLGGILFHGLFNLMYGQRLTDPTTMYKVFRTDCLEGITLISNRFDLDFELVAKLIRAGFSPMEIPVNYKSRGFEEGKKVRVILDPLTWIWAIFRFRFMRLNPKVTLEESVTREI